MGVEVWGKQRDEMRGAWRGGGGSQGREAILPPIIFIDD